MKDMGLARKAGNVLITYPYDKVKAERVRDPLVGIFRPC